jgi:replicative DNA helicase
MLNAQEIKRGGLRKTGYPSLDNYIRGIFNSDCVMIVSDTGGKKTGFSRNLAATNAPALSPLGYIVVFSLELMEEDEFERYIPMIMDIDTEELLEIYMNNDKARIKEIRKAMGVYHNIITVTKTIDIDDLEKWIYFIEHELNKENKEGDEPKKVKLIIIDYIQKMRNRLIRNPLDKAPDIANRLKDINIETGIPQIWISQTSRDSAEKKTYYAKGSGDYENSAQVVLHLHFPNEKEIMDAHAKGNSPWGYYHDEIMRVIEEQHHIDFHLLTVRKEKRRKKGLQRPHVIIKADNNNMTMREYEPIVHPPLKYSKNEVYLILFS